MSKITDLWILHTIANVKNAATGDVVTYMITKGHYNYIFYDPTHPHNERERNRTDEYHIVLNPPLDATKVEDIGIHATGKDAWLPRTMWLVAKYDDDKIALLGHFPKWPSNKWLSLDTREGYPYYSIMNHPGKEEPVYSESPKINNLK